MILAIKDKIACFYNTEEEKKEILELFIDNKNIEYKIFNNTDKDNALNYSNTFKITGFLTPKDPFNEINELKDKGIQFISFKVNDEKYCAIINDIFYPRSSYRLVYDEDKREFKKYKFNGNLRDTANDLCSQIINLQKSELISTETAVLRYNQEYRKVFGESFWKYISADKFFDWGFSDSILFKCIGKRLKAPIISFDEYYYQLEEKQEDMLIKKSDMSDIKITESFLSIKNKNINNYIKENLYF